jgi:hypothetical protein
MMLKAALFSALLGALIHPPYQAKTETTYGLGEWRLTVAKDNFTHQTTCRLVNRRGSAPDVTVTPDMVRFHFGHRFDTSDAWYQLDSAPPRPWRDLGARLAEAGEMTAVERLDNATSGVVVMPVSALGDAKQITLRIDSRHAPRSYDLKMLRNMLASANGQGCGLAS